MDLKGLVRTENYQLGRKRTNKYIKGHKMAQRTSEEQKVQKRGVLRNAYYLQDVVHSVHLIYVARLYGVLACSTYQAKADPKV